MLVGYARVSTRDQNPAPQVDTSSTGRRLIVHVIGAVAKFERDLTHERTRANLVSAHTLGQCSGRKPSMGDAEIKRTNGMLANLTMPIEDAPQLMSSRGSALYRHVTIELSALQGDAV